MHENLRPLCVIDPPVGSVRCLCFYVHLCWDFSVLASIVFSWFFVNCILRLVLGPVILLFSKRKPHYDPYIWLGYTVLFIVDFVLVFTLVEDRLNEERSPRPVIFEAVLCITPLLLLLLLNTADDNDVERLGDFKWLCASMTLQVFDAIEMIDIVVSEKGKGSEIDKVNGIGMIALAYASLLLSALQLVHSVHYKSTCALRDGEKIRLGLLITAAIINFVSMIIRVVVLVEYGTNETIFIAKNIILDQGEKYAVSLILINRVLMKYNLGLKQLPATATAMKWNHLKKTFIFEERFSFERCVMLTHV